MIALKDLLNAKRPIVTNEVPHDIKQAAPKNTHNAICWSKNAFPINSP